MGTEEKNTSHKKEIEFSRDMKEKYLPDVGKIIGKTLKSENCVLEKKHPNGTFKCDLLVKMPEGNAVIIENQKEDSDHDHFGKLFTYSTMLSDDKCHVTDVVWVLINGKDRVHTEHFNAVNVINRLCESKGIEFKIWLLIAEYKEGGGYSFRQAEENDIWKRNSRDTTPLHPFMVKLKEAIENDERTKNHGSVSNSGNYGKCLGISCTEKIYSINIPYRSTKKVVKVEAAFKKNNNQAYYKEMITSNFDGDKEEWCDVKDPGFIGQYDIMPTGDGEYVNISGTVSMDSIDSEEIWYETIDKVLDLLDKIFSFADYESDKYSD